MSFCKTSNACASASTAAWLDRELPTSWVIRSLKADSCTLADAAGGLQQLGGQRLQGLQQRRQQVGELPEVIAEQRHVRPGGRRHELEELLPLGAVQVAAHRREHAVQGVPRGLRDGLNVVQ